MKTCDCNQGRLPCTCHQDLEGWTSVSDAPVPIDTPVYLKSPEFNDGVFWISAPDLSSPVLMRGVSWKASRSSVNTAASGMTNERYLTITHWKPAVDKNKGDYNGSPSDVPPLFTIKIGEAAKVITGTFGEPRFNVTIGVGARSEHSHCVVIGTNIKSDHHYQVKIGNSEISTSREMTPEEFDEVYRAVHMIAYGTQPQTRESAPVEQDKTQYYATNSALGIRAYLYAQEKNGVIYKATQHGSQIIQEGDERFTDSASDIADICNKGIYEKDQEAEAIKEKICELECNSLMLPQRMEVPAVHESCDVAEAEYAKGFNACIDQMEAARADMELKP